MSRPVTLFTGQWADLPLEELAKKATDWGYDGLELACWGDHMEADRATAPDTECGPSGQAYCEEKVDMLGHLNLRVWAISSHLAGQLVADRIDARHLGFAPKAIQDEYEAWKESPAGKKALAVDLTAVPPHIAEKARDWGIDQMKKAAMAAKNIGAGVVCGFTGSPIWHMIYSFPPASEAMIEQGFERFANLWNPILDVFDECGIRFALEVHPTEIAFDIITARRALKAVGNRKAFGFNFDPSHLYWQFVDPVRFLEEFADRIYHVHMKDCERYLNGTSGILGSHINFGSPGRGWEFRSNGRGGVDFEGIILKLNHIGYDGPLSVEWEDAAMDREHGAAEACAFVRGLDFPKSNRVFDEAFSKK